MALFRSSAGRTRQFCPGISDVDFSAISSVVELCTEISDRAFDLGVAEEQLNAPQVYQSGRSVAFVRRIEWVAYLSARGRCC
jgi:hypothetical protein